ncbi:MAG: DNA polymerase III subunit beta [Candidatus Onthovivens sp.]|nr:DNA polymerase III subunit beta [Candidatus Onthovivens sp.]
MKFIIKKDYFLKGLLSVTKIIQIKAINPILSNIKLDLTLDGLSLTGSNGELSIMTTIPFFDDSKEIIRDYSKGATLINAFLITEIVKRLSGNEISFELLDDSIAKIECDKSLFKLNSIRAEEYLDLSFDKIGAKINLTTELFNDIVNQVAFAASIKDNRPSLTAVNLESDTSRLLFTATDTARLARKEVDIQTKERINANIPSKTVMEVQRSITTEKDINMYISDKKVLFCLKNMYISSSLKSGEYPNTKNIIPSNFFYTLEVNGNELISAMDVVSLLSQEKDNVVKLSMNSNKVEVSSKSQQNGTGSVLIENFSFKSSNERLDISFNYEFVKSAIKALKSDDVVISFIGEIRPFTITTKNDPSVIHLITPYRTY